MNTVTEYLDGLKRAGNHRTHNHMDKKIGMYRKINRKTYPPIKVFIPGTLPNEK